MENCCRYDGPSVKEQKKTFFPSPSFGEGIYICIFPHHSIKRFYHPSIQVGYIKLYFYPTTL